MKESVYKEQVYSKIIITILMTCPILITTVVRTFIIREMSFTNNMIFLVLIIMIIGIILLCFIGKKKIIIGNDGFSEKGLLRKRHYSYSNIDNCFYDDVQKTICIVNGCKIKKISLEHYEQRKRIISELQKFIEIEEL